MLHRRKLNGKPLFTALTALFIVLLLLSACGNSSNNGANETNQAGSSGTDNQTPASNETSEPAIVKDALGNEVEIPASPQRVLGSYLEDHLVALGVKPVAQWSVANGIQNYLQPAGLQGVPTISYNLPPEEVLSVDPDFILVGSASLVQNDMYGQYAKIAPTYVLGDDLIKDWRQTLTKIGQLLHKEDAAKAALDKYEQKVAATKEQVKSVIGEKPVAILWLTQKQFYMVDDKLSSGTVLYGDLGLTPSNMVLDLPEEAKATWNPVTIEKLAELNAEYIFLLNYDKGQGTDTLDSPIWKGLPAVKAGQVYELDSQSSWLYSGAIAGEQVMDDLVRMVVK